MDNLVTELFFAFIERGACLQRDAMAYVISKAKDAKLPLVQTIKFIESAARGSMNSRFLHRINQSFENVTHSQRTPLKRQCKQVAINEYAPSDCLLP